MRTIQAALSARVSAERHAMAQTIASQRAARACRGGRVRVARGHAVS